jgi:heptose-I-phosphate ethanolaminephosphotransferase
MALKATARRILGNIYVRSFAAFVATYLASYLALRLMGVPQRIASVNGLSIIFMALPVWGLVLLARRHAKIGYRLYFVWAVIWVVDFFAVSFTMWRYGVQVESPVIVEAVSNANYQETTEYIRDALLFAVPLLIIVPLIAYGMMRLARGLGRHLETVNPPRWVAITLGVVLIVLPLAIHSNHVVARADPVTRWAKFYSQMRQQEIDRVQLVANREQAEKNVGTWAPKYSGPPQRTVVFVIGESSNRSDWSLFGYPRETTPRLEKLRDKLVLFPDTVSSFGSTLVEVIRMLTSATRTDDASWQTQPDVLLLAKAAGYKVFWLTNQNDFFLNTVFGKEADAFKLVNTGLGQRTDTSLDERLLPELDKALADPAPLKFIVLHSIGSHQHYSLRYSDAFAKFDGADDEISKAMAAKWSWLATMRNTYDNTILYTDYFLTEVIGRLDRVGTKESEMLFVSDHAQEVGHLTNSWGHNFKLESGFTVPMFLWTKNDTLLSAKAGYEARPYQTDELDWTLLSMLRVGTNRDKPTVDLLGKDFKPWPRVLDGRPYIPGKSHIVPPAGS